MSFSLKSVSGWIKNWRKSHTAHNRLVLQVLLAVVLLVLLVGMNSNLFGVNNSQQAVPTSTRVVALAGSDGDLLAHIRTTVAEKDLSVQWLSVTDVPSIFSFLTYETAVAVLCESETFKKYGAEDQVSLGPAYQLHNAFYFTSGGTVSDIPDETVVSLPENFTQQTVALDLLSEAGLIALGEGEGISSVTSNPKRLVLRVVPQNEITSALDSGNLVFVYGLLATQLALHEPVIVSSDSEAHILVASKSWSQSNEAKKLLEVLKSEESKKYLKSKWGEIVSFP